MRTMTLEELLMKEDDKTLLDIYTELESCVVPATGYAHAYCRKINKMINAGKLCTVRDKYRNVYLPTLSKMIFKEMARRFAMSCYNTKTLTTNVTPNEEVPAVTHKCSWCGEEFDATELRITELGELCESCVAAIRSRGEDLMAVL